MDDRHKAAYKTRIHDAQALIERLYFQASNLRAQARERRVTHTLQKIRTAIRTMTEISRVIEAENFYYARLERALVACKVDGLPPPDVLYDDNTGEIQINGVLSIHKLRELVLANEPVLPVNIDNRSR